MSSTFDQLGHSELVAGDSAQFLAVVEINLNDLVPVVEEMAIGMTADQELSIFGCHLPQGREEALQHRLGTLI
jgi:hypothetical protein